MNKSNKLQLYILLKPSKVFHPFKQVKFAQKNAVNVLQLLMNVPRLEKDADMLILRVKLMLMNSLKQEPENIALMLHTQTHIEPLNVPEAMFQELVLQLKNVSLQQSVFEDTLIYYRTSNLLTLILTIFIFFFFHLRISHFKVLYT